MANAIALDEDRSFREETAVSNHDIARMKAFLEFRDEDAGAREPAGNGPEVRESGDRRLLPASAVVRGNPPSYATPGPAFLT